MNKNFERLYWKLMHLWSIVISMFGSGYDLCTRSTDKRQSLWDTFSAAMIQLTQILQVQNLG